MSESGRSHAGAEHERAPAKDGAPQGQSAPFTLPAGYREYYGVTQAKADPGATLPDDVRSKMEGSFGADLGSVRVHESAAPRGIGASAYTQGEHLHFAPGRFDPSSQRGQSLIGHEVTHVLQQRAGRVQAPQGKDGFGISTDVSLEREADLLGERAANGLPAIAPGSTSGIAAAGAVQRQLEDQPFGQYWVGPNEPDQQHAQVERITVGDFGQLSQLWAQLSAGHAGTLSITELDSKNQAHAGFKDRIVASLGKLLSRPHGRRLVTELTAGGKSVLIEPLRAGDTASNANTPGDDRTIGMRSAEGVAGVKADAVVQIDAQLDDENVKAYDHDYNEISQPAFILLGHELIHARHLTAGIAAPREAAPAHADYDEQEEQETIDSGNEHDPRGMTENMLRGEHGKTARFGHKGLHAGDDHCITVPGSAVPIAEMLVLGGVTLPRLLTDNPKLAGDLLDQHPELLRARVTSGNHDALRGELEGRDPDDIAILLEDGDMWMQVAMPALCADPDLLVSAMAASNQQLHELFEVPEILDAIGKLKLTDQIGARAQENARTVLSSLPNLLQELATHPYYLAELRKAERVRALVRDLPQIKLGVGLRDAGAAQMLQRMGATADQVVAQTPAAASAACPAFKLQLAGCTQHRVRRVGQLAQTLGQIKAEHADLRGDDQLLHRLNPKIDLQALAVGALVVVPITAQ